MKAKVIISIMLIAVAANVCAFTLFGRNIENDVVKITGELTEEEKEIAIFTANFLIMKSGKELAALSNDEYKKIIESSAKLCKDKKVKSLMKLGELGKKGLEELILFVHSLTEKLVDSIAENRD